MALLTGCKTRDQNTLLGKNAACNICCRWICHCLSVRKDKAGCSN